MASWIHRCWCLLCDALRDAATEQPGLLAVCLLLVVATTIVAAFGVQI